MQDMPRGSARFALVLLAALGLGSASAEPAAPTGDAATAAAKPSAAIDALHASLLDVMKNAESLGYAGREQKLRTVIPKYFDVDEMARQSLGGPHWKAASEDEKKRYL